LNVLLGWREVLSADLRPVNLVSKEAVKMNLVVGNLVIYHQHFLQGLRHRRWSGQVKLKIWQGITESTSHSVMDKTGFATPMGIGIIARR
jgi:hypothetical protein